MRIFTVRKRGMTTRIVQYDPSVAQFVVYYLTLDGVVSFDGGCRQPTTWFADYVRGWLLEGCDVLNGWADAN